MPPCLFITYCIVIVTYAITLSQPRFSVAIAGREEVATRRHYRHYYHHYYDSYHAVIFIATAYAIYASATYAVISLRRHAYADNVVERLLIINSIVFINIRHYHYYYFQFV